MRLTGGLSLLVGYHAEACLLAGRHDEAATLAARAVALAREHRERGYEAMALRITGEAALARNDVRAAEAALIESSAVAEALGMQPLLGHDDLGLGLAARRRGDDEESRRRLTAARTRYAELGMAAWVSRADETLDAAAR